MSNLCIIPARGGSKRIPKKNIKDFLGKPIISYSIKSAKQSNLFDEIIVSTDDKNIAKIAKKFGVRVPFIRSKKNSDDFASTFDVLKEVIFYYKKKKIFFDNICCFYPCAPLVSPNLLIEAYERLIKKKYDSIFPIVAYGHPVQRAFKEVNGKVFMQSDKNLNIRSQDLEVLYHDAGQFYWCNTNKLLENEMLITLNSGGIIIPELHAQDIDKLIDWKLAELKYNLINK